MPSTSPRLALVTRAPVGEPLQLSPRLAPLVAGLEAAGIHPIPVGFDEAALDAVRESLLGCAGALVWVNPLAAGRDRSLLDPLLRQVASTGRWVSAHPHTILAMGTKEVLVRTRSLGWGSDTHGYASFAAFQAQFPARLAAAAGPLMLKRSRGNDGQDVMKVAPLPGGAVSVQTAGDDRLEAMPLADFIRRCGALFDGDGRLVEQPFQPRVGEGMVRCYLSADRVVGFGQQAPRISDPASPIPPLGMNSAKAMQPADAPHFAGLRRSMEADWVPGMLRLLGLAAADLPVIWDADFLLGPRDAAGQDSYVLCEINVSSVLPFPEFAVPDIVHTVRRRLAGPTA